MRVLRSSFSGLLLALGAQLAAAQPPPVNVELRPDEITVGDRVEAKLTLVWDGEAPASTPAFPAWQETWGKAEVLAVGDVEAFDRAGRRIYSQTLTLTAFEAGEIELPSRIVTVALAGQTVEIPTRAQTRLTVGSVLPTETGTELEPRPAAPLAAWPGGRRFVWTNAALAALCILAALWILRRLDRPQPVVAAGKPLLSPLDEVLETLKRLDPAAGSEPAHTAMSLALRRFLGRALDFPALECTTSEIHRILGHLTLSRETGRRAVDFLRDCDQVKFARLEVAEAVTAERLEKLRRLAVEIDKSLRPAEPRDSMAEAA